jgi:S-DNA-T family DNA segregation ATPase FtsK/SpoIIIE
LFGPHLIKYSSAIKSARYSKCNACWEISLNSSCKEIETPIARLAQLARAIGIHLIVATQRPTTNIITGTIKANFPARIAFRVTSRFDSRTILNEMGAEQLLGSGDMLFLENGANLVRLHGGYVSENEIENVVNYIKSQSVGETLMDITNQTNNAQKNELNFDEQLKAVDQQQ